MDKERRLRRVVVARQAAGDLFREDVSIINGIPSNADVEAIYTDAERDAVEFIVSHESYDAVPEGQTIPRAEIVAQVDEPDRTNARVHAPAGGSE